MASSDLELEANGDHVTAQAERTFATQSTSSHPTPLSNQEMPQDIMHAEIDMDFTGFWSLTNGGDNRALVEANIPTLFPEGTHPGTMSSMPDVQTNVATLIQSSELDCLNWPNIKTSQAVSETIPMVNAESGEEELSSHTLAELYV